MSNNAYTAALADVYDRLNSGIDITAWADFIISCIEKYSDTDVKHVCELACGTGSMSLELAKRGYRVTAIDSSADMLAIAEHKSRKDGCDIRFSEQDMRGFSIYSEADLMLCLLDGVNYLTSPADLRAAFGSAFSQLAGGGLFLFDVNSKYKFRNVYARHSYILEDDGVLCAWRNDFNPKTGMCDFYLSIFKEREDGTYERNDEWQRERMYTIRQLQTALTSCGFEIMGIFSDFSFSPADENNCERLYFAAKKKAGAKGGSENEYER